MSRLAGATAWASSTATYAIIRRIDDCGGEGGRHDGGGGASQWLTVPFGTYDVDNGDSGDDGGGGGNDCGDDSGGGNSGAIPNGGNDGGAGSPSLAIRVKPATSYSICRARRRSNGDEGDEGDDGGSDDGEGGDGDDDCNGGDTGGESHVCPSRATPAAPLYRLNCGDDGGGGDNN